MLEGRPYSPLLHARLAELRALRELPDTTKNLLVPIIKLRPWLNAKTLDKALEVVEQAVGNRLYGLDLDESKFELVPDPGKPARVEFAALFNAEDGYRRYYELVASGSNRVPVFRGINAPQPQVDEQLDRIRGLERGGFVRAPHNSPGAILDVVQRAHDRAIENIVFVIDCGWGRDLLTRSAICAGLVQQIVDIAEDFEIVISGSSFPDSFNGLGPRFETLAQERSLFQEVRRAVNGGNLIYGDWGSTRPPSDPVPMRNIPRIDVARSSNWLSWRSEDEEDYQDLAIRAMNDPEWEGDLGIWGEYMIESTASGSDGAIRSPAMAAAVRVNFHLHRQANFENPDGLHIGDEVVGDDL